MERGGSDPLPLRRSVLQVGELRRINAGLRFRAEILTTLAWGPTATRLGENQGLL